MKPGERTILETVRGIRLVKWMFCPLIDARYFLDRVREKL